MNPDTLCGIHRVSHHVWQITLTTATLPPADTTNSYLVVSGSDGLLIDVGTADTAQLGALTAAIRDCGVRRLQLLATHHHPDHTVGLPHLQTAWQAPLYIHPQDANAACKTMGLDRNAVEVPPDHLSLAGLDIAVDHAPGHTHGHVHVRIPADDLILVGDHLSGAGTVWIGPPDGHLETYLHALDAIAASGCRLAGPGHGGILTDASAAAQAMKQRRLRREAKVIELLRQQPRSLQELTETMYGGSIPAGAMTVAKRTLRAHLQRLLDLRQVTRHYVDGRFIYEVN
jgi:ribonuclease/clavin/mitogillin